MAVGKSMGMGFVGKTKKKNQRSTKSFDLSTGRIGFHLLRKGILGKE